jgi:hypothetical protein
MAKWLVALLVLLAACSASVDTGSSPEDVAVGYAEAAFDQDWGQAWASFHPAVQAQTTRADFTACAAGVGDGPAPDVDVSTGDPFVENGVTYVNVRLEAGGFTDSVLMALLEVDGVWLVADIEGGESDEPCIVTPDGFAESLVE